MSLGKNVRALREALGWTLDELAERSGVDLGTISALELRGSLRSKYAGRLAGALGVTVDRLLSDGPISRDDRSAATHETTAAGGAPKWPFKRVTPNDYDLLSPDDMDEVEGLIELKLKKARPVKRNTSDPAAA